MKKLIEKVLAWFGRIAMDKWQHIALGSSIAAVCLFSADPLALVMSGKAACVVAGILSILVTTAIELWKEYRHDAAPDRRDIVATLLGGLKVWLPWFTAIAVM